MFRNLQAGDVIAVVESFTLTRHVTIKRVAKRTPTQIHLESGEKFSVETGVAIGHKSRSSSKRISDTHDQVVLGALAKTVVDKLHRKLGKHDCGFSGYPGIIKMLGEMRDELDSAIELVRDPDKLVEDASGN